MGSGFPGDIPEIAITWKVITILEEDLSFSKTLWNIWASNLVVYTFRGYPPRKRPSLLMSSMR